MKLFRSLVAVATLVLAATSAFTPAYGQEDGRVLHAPQTATDWGRMHAWLKSNDTAKIVFTDVSGNVYVTTRDGKERQLLVTRANSITFAPDGDRFAYEQSGTLIVVNMAMGNVQTFSVSDGGFPVQDCAWSPKGDEIAAAFGTGRIGFVNPDDGKVSGFVMKRFDTRYSPAHLTWSPDASKMAFESNGRLYVVRRNAVEPQRVLGSATPDGTHFTSPVWLSGDTLVYGYWRSGFYDCSIRKTSLSGDWSLVTDVPTTPNAVSLSPDHTTVVYGGFEDGGYAGLYAARVSDGARLGMVARTDLRATTWYQPKGVISANESPNWDVDRSGVTDITDLVRVVTEGLDVNGDGIHDIVDIVTVAIHFGEAMAATFAAPAMAQAQDRKFLSRVLDEIRVANDGSPEFTQAEETIRRIIDFVPEVKSQGKRPMTWAEMKK